jgi:Fuc2NAc and GlcNAc transferase
MKMPIMAALITLPLSWLLTRAVLGYAMRRKILDHPGERSLHDVPTPRGGGIAIAVCVIAGTALLAFVGGMPRNLALALVGGGAVVAITGWIDDRTGLPAAARALCYLCAAALAAWLLGGLDRIAIGSLVLNPGWMGVPLAALGIAWLTNLYNFMDGADGIAAAQGISAGAFAAALFALAGYWAAAALCAIVAASCAGFLFFNWPPARLFMGDVGSCLLGFTFGALALYGEYSGAAPLSAWLLLLLVFVVDATLTLARRVLRGEKWYSPHRTHAYQLLVQSGLGHRGLLIGFIAVNALLLGPAVLVAARSGALPAVTVMLTLVAAVAWIGIQIRCKRRTGARVRGDNDDHWKPG